MAQSLSMALSRRERWNRILAQPKFLTILCLGFASGLPLVLTGSTLQAWYAVSQVDIVTIGVLTLLGQPYVYKFLWAPLLDRYSLPWLGRRLGWVFFFQLLLVIGLMVMGCLQPDREPIGLAFVALVVAFLSASQDVVVDAYRTEALTPTERGLGAGLNTMGYRIAMLIAGAVALVLADHVGWQMTYWIMAGLMAVQLIVTYISSYSETHNPEVSPSSLWHALSDPLKVYFQQHYAWSILFFILIYKLGDVFTLILGSAFLIRGVGFSLTDIGLIYKLVGMLGIFVGVGVGGYWMTRISLYRALILFGIIQAFTNLPFLFLAIVGKNYWLLVLTVFIENLGSGLGSVAFLAFIMSLCDHRYTATQYALLSAVAAMGRVFVGPIAGLMVAHMGWTHYFFWSFLLGFPGVAMIALIRNHPSLQTNPKSLAS